MRMVLRGRTEWHRRDLLPRPAKLAATLERTSGRRHQATVQHWTLWWVPGVIGDCAAYLPP